MLMTIERTRPILSPSQPKAIPPVAAPNRNAAVMMPVHMPTWASLAIPMLFTAGRTTWGKSPISTPSNIQPRKHAAKTSHCEKIRPFFSTGSGPLPVSARAASMVIDALSFGGRWLAIGREIALYRTSETPASRCRERMVC